MLVDVRLHPKDQGRGTYDVQLRGVPGRRHIARLYPKDQGRGIHDVQLRPANLIVAVVAGGGGFPTQFAGLRTFYGAAVKELCLVAQADAPTGMGGGLFINKNGTTYSVYLVETTDPNASNVRISTTTGTKAVRLKT